LPPLEEDPADIQSSSDQEFFDAIEESSEENSLANKLSEKSTKVASSAANCVAQDSHGRLLKKKFQWKSLGFKRF
jgi:hypothetical protein